MHACAREGRIGDLLSARARYGWAGPWWNEWFYQPGGGSLFDLGVYNVTTLCALFGSVRRVTAMVGTAIAEREVNGRKMTVEADDNAHVLLDFGNARFGVVTTGFTMQKYRSPAVEVYGSEGTMQMLGDDWAPDGWELWRNEEALWQRASGDRSPLAVDRRPPASRGLHRERQARRSHGPSTHFMPSRSCSRRRRPALTARPVGSRRTSPSRSTAIRCSRPKRCTAPTIGEVTMGYKPSPRPTFDRPTALRFDDVTRHTWGNPEVGLVDDWIYVSSNLLHTIVFGMDPGRCFRHTEDFRTIFGADEVLHVLQGTFVIANPETGEVLRAEKGESVFFRKDTWHHGFSFGAEPVRVLEFFAPPPATGTSGPYARTREYLRWSGGRMPTTISSARSLTTGRARERCG